MKKIGLIEGDCTIMHRNVYAIYKEHENDGISNRQILRKFIHPIFGIGERQFYYILRKYGKGTDTQCSK